MQCVLGIPGSREVIFSFAFEIFPTALFVRAGERLFFAALSVSRFSVCSSGARGAVTIYLQYFKELFFFV